MFGLIAFSYICIWRGTLCARSMLALLRSRQNLVFIASIASLPCRMVCNWFITSLLHLGSAKLPSNKVLNCAHKSFGATCVAFLCLFMYASFQTFAVPLLIKERA